MLPVGLRLVPVAAPQGARGGRGAAAPAPVIRLPATWPRIVDEATCRPAKTRLHTAVPAGEKILNGQAPRGGTGGTLPVPSPPTVGFPGSSNIRSPGLIHPVAVSGSGMRGRGCRGRGRLTSGGQRCVQRTASAPAALSQVSPADLLSVHAERERERITARLGGAGTDNAPGGRPGRPRRVRGW